MKFSELSTRALKIHELFKKRETKKWGKKDIMLGLVGDVGDLAKLVLAHEGIRVIPDQQKKLEHELSDCLWSLLILAHEYNVTLDEAFLRTMDELEEKIGLNCAQA